MTSLHWQSNSPTIATAYGIQTALNIPRIAALGVFDDISLSCPYSLITSPLPWDGRMIYGSAGDAFGNDTLPKMAAEHDLTITLCDVFSLKPCAQQLAGLNVAHWIPVDCEPMAELDAAVLREGGGQPVAVSCFGRRMLQAEGFDSLYVPHGVDTVTFRPDPAAGLAFREQAGIGPDTFIVGINAVNRADHRKSWWEQMAAFAAFREKHPDSVLFAHTRDREAWDLPKMALQLGISQAIMFPDQYAYGRQMIPAPSMAAWYNALRPGCLSLASHGEGFGLPVLEAMACGIVPVATRASAMTELAGPCGFLADGEDFWVGGHDAKWTRPHIASITACYHEAYIHQDRGAECREFAETYDIDRIADQYWRPVLKELTR